jgi:hypothetical protein
MQQVVITEAHVRRVQSGATVPEKVAGLPLFLNNAPTTFGPVADLRDEHDAPSASQLELQLWWLLV